MATELGQVFKCEMCGNVVVVVHAADGDLVCCGQPMVLLKENTVDAAYEKHIPVLEKTATGYLVKVGSVPHPMEAKHWIEWVELMDLDQMKIYTKCFKPGDKPEAEFCLKADRVVARAYCNLHGLWKSQ